MDQRTRIIISGRLLSARSGHRIERGLMNRSFVASVFLLLLAVVANAVELIVHMGNTTNPWRLLSPVVAASFIPLLAVLSVSMFSKALTADRRTFLGMTALALIVIILGYSRTDMLGETLFVIGLLLIFGTIFLTLRMKRTRRT